MFRGRSGHLLEGGGAHLAARVGNLDTLRVLLAAKPEIGNSVDRNKETPLHVACRAGHEALAAVLKFRGANIMAKTTAASWPRTWPRGWRCGL